MHRGRKMKKIGMLTMTNTSRGKGRSKKRSWIIFLVVASGFLTQCSVPHRRPVLGPGQILVEPGDSVYRLANRYHVRVRDLVSTNRLEPPYMLHEGQVLLLPSFEQNARGDEQAQVEKEKASEEPRRDGPALLTGSETKDPDVPEEERPEEKPFSSDAPWKGNAGAAMLEQDKGLDKEATESLDPKILSELKRNKALCALDAEKREAALKKCAPCPPKAGARPGKVEEKCVSGPPSFRAPVHGKVVAEFRAKKGGKPCNGVRLSVEENTSIAAAAGGRVLFVGDGLGKQGKIIAIEHSGGWLTAYGPLNNIRVKAGQVVRSGEPIGSTAKNPDGFYFEVRENRQVRDPQKYVKFR